MSTPGPDYLLAEEEELHAAPAPEVAPSSQPWHARMALAGRLFIAVGAAIFAGATLANPLEHTDVVSCGVTLVVAGGVLRATASAAERART